MKTLLTTILGTFLLAAYTAHPEERYQSESLGISIEPPAHGDTENPSYTVAQFFLPHLNGFSANVNIQKQHYPDSLESYEELSKGQFEEMGMKILTSTRSDTELFFAAHVVLQGNDLHFYARAIKKGDAIFLATGTTLHTDWESQKEAITASVKSFRVGPEK